LHRTPRMNVFDRLDALPALSPEERQLLDSVTALARDEIAPRAAGYDRNAEFPWDNIRAINRLGLNAMFVPEAYGGAGLSYAAYLYLVFGKWAELGDARNAISGLYLEKGTPGLTVSRTEDKMGHRAASTAAIAFDNCRVPRANLLGMPGEGLKLLLAALNKSRPSVAAHALGIARAAFEDAVAYV